MNTQRGSTGVTVLVVLGVVVSLAALFGFFLVSAYNGAVSAERQIEAAWENNQNVLSSYVNRITEMVQVPEIQQEHFKERIKASMEGRYGPDGSQAVFQWIQEQSIQLDSSVYTNLQREIASGRRDFEREQTTLLDLKRSYKTRLQRFPGTIAYAILGFPRADLDKYNIIVASEVTDRFESGVDRAVQLR